MQKTLVPAFLTLIIEISHTSTFRAELLYVIFRVFCCAIISCARNISFQKVHENWIVGNRKKEK